MDNYTIYFGLAILIIEWFLGQSKLIKSNSIIAIVLTMVMNVLKRFKK